MTLPIPPNSISLGQINTELGNTSTDEISLNDSAVRGLTPNSTYADAYHGTGINTTTNTTISMYELYGASAAGAYSSFTANRTSMNEGQSVTFTVVTSGVANGTTVGYTVTGVNNSDFSSGTTSGSITINSNTGSASWTLANDATTENTETMTVTLAATDSAGDSTGSLSDSVTIYDTSTTPADTYPNSFSFTAVTGATRNTYYSAGTNNPITGINTSVTASASNGAYVSLDDSNWYSSVSISNNQTLYVRLQSSGSYSTQVSTTVSVGSPARTASFSITTEAAPDITPDDFNFADFTSATPNTLYTRSTTIEGINTNVTATAGAGDQVSNNGSTWGSSTTIAPNGTLYLRTTSSSNYSTTVTASATINGVTGGFDVTTYAPLSVSVSGPSNGAFTDYDWDGFFGTGNTGTATSGTATTNVSGGSGGYSYQWSLVSYTQSGNDATLSGSSFSSAQSSSTKGSISAYPSSSTGTIGLNDFVSETVAVVIKCTVTDSDNNTASDNSGTFTLSFFWQENN